MGRQFLCTLPTPHLLQRQSLCAPPTWYRETVLVCPPTWYRETFPVCSPSTWYRDTVPMCPPLHLVQRGNSCLPSTLVIEIVSMCPPTPGTERHFLCVSSPPGAERQSLCAPPNAVQRESLCTPSTTSPCSERESLSGSTAPPPTWYRDSPCVLPHTGRQSLCTPVLLPPYREAVPVHPLPCPPGVPGSGGLCACCITLGWSPALCCSLAASSPCSCKGNRPPGLRGLSLASRGGEGLTRSGNLLAVSIHLETLWPAPRLCAQLLLPCQGAGLWLSLGRGDSFFGPSLHDVLGPQAWDTASGATAPRMYKMYIGNIYMDAL
ncbi:uncharacterized protein LOC122459083 [Dermochelys coriacea]|uniref:uncharacterized protein LOC122459083 n=1 Tax=Dermochelys coriacea TaxID=27794 RepID=UPI001CA9BC35|nr:uncharacterized protein LOC122459083 [Dermochelys coriacea]